MISSPSRWQQQQERERSRSKAAKVDNQETCSKDLCDASGVFGQELNEAGQIIGIRLEDSVNEQLRLPCDSRCQT